MYNTTGKLSKRNDGQNEPRRRCTANESLSVTKHSVSASVGRNCHDPLHKRRIPVTREGGQLPKKRRIEQTDSDILEHPDQNVPGIIRAPSSVSELANIKGWPGRRR